MDRELKEILTIRTRRIKDNDEGEEIGTSVDEGLRMNMKARFFSSWSRSPLTHTETYLPILTLNVFIIDEMFIE